MATVRRVPRSPYWIAKYRDGESIKFRSTKQTSKSGALKIALDWEDQARLANAGELTQATVLKMANDLLERLGQKSVGKQSIENFANRWLQTGLKKDSTRSRYGGVVDSFLRFLGPRRVKASVGSVTTQEIEQFRDEELRQGKTSSTADYSVKVLRIMFERAKRTSERLDNPADAITSLRGEQLERKAFSDSQLLQLFRAGNDEWKGMILFGAFAGLRLNDAANLTWNQIDLTAESLTYLPAKNSLRKRVPISIALHGNILDFLRGSKKPKEAKAPVFPSLAGRKSGSAGGLSNQFAALMVRVGLRVSEPRETKILKNTKSRRFHELGFHSTRHYFISKLANADVPLDVRKALAAHSTDKAHARYVHLELETQRRAIQNLPAISAHDSRTEHLPVRG